jgi:hypothetical protein
MVLLSCSIWQFTNFPHALYLISASFASWDTLSRAQMPSENKRRPQLPLVYSLDHWVTFHYIVSHSAMYKTQGKLLAMEHMQCGGTGYARELFHLMTTLFPAGISILLYCWGDPSLKASKQWSQDRIPVVFGTAIAQVWKPSADRACLMDTNR